jgi:hypothetical protein
MPSERRYSVHANGDGCYWVTYYCYDSNCPARTKEKPWPRSEGELKWVNLISKKGNTYRRRRWCCNHCGKEMTGAVNANDFA